MKKFARLSLFAMVATMAVTLSSFVNEPVSTIGDGSGTDQRQYEGTCPSGKKITVCGVNGSGCTAAGEC